MTSMNLISLPNEILYQILSELDDGAPSLKRLRREPTLALTSSESTPLKDLSITCSFFRSLLLPILFRFTRIYMNGIFVDNQDGLHVARSPDTEQCLTFLKKNSLSSVVQGVVFYTERDFEMKYSDIGAEHLAKQRAVNGLWRMALSAISPSFITICAPPTTLGRLTRCPVQMKDSWAFNMPLQILHLSRSSAAKWPLTIEYRDLFHIIPWTHCTLNEGSSLNVYSTYEYHIKTMPSILDCTGRLRAQCPTLQSLDYIAIFPPARQSLALRSFIMRSPAFRRLGIQLTPHSADRILENDQRVQEALLSDMWMEHVDFYAKLLTWIPRKNFRVDSQSSIFLAETTVDPLLIRKIYFKSFDLNPVQLREHLEGDHVSCLNQWEECNDDYWQMKRI
ncbi:hypothetical protein MMC14_007013 [Varicellaria rhodocarpa]|nr:hypothetical protein [Varicellaria rhodocarpa]